MLAAAVLLHERPASARGGAGGGGESGPGGGPGGGPGNGPGGGTGSAGTGSPGAGGQSGHGAGASGSASGGRRGGQSPRAGPTAPRGGGGRAVDPEREFVGLFASPQAIATAERLGLDVEQRALPTLGLVISRFRAVTPAQAGAAQAQLRQAERAGALYAPNSVYRPMAAPCGDGGCTAAGLRRAARSATACRQRRPIGMIDTEVEQTHPALRSGSIDTARFLPAPSATPASDGHGTAIAALLIGDPASRYPGVAPGARLYAANAFSQGPENDVQANAYNLAEALEWLAGVKPGVINLSLAGPPNLLLQAALTRTIDLGIVVVAAAGNGGPGAPPAYPAAYDRVIAVTAVDDAQRPYVWANQGDYVTLAAPGVGLWTADRAASGVERSGTSLAAALFSGLVAGAAPPQARGAGAVADWARRNAVDLGPPGRDPVFGWGIVRIDAPCAE